MTHEGSTIILKKALKHRYVGDDMFGTNFAQSFGVS